MRRIRTELHGLARRLLACSALGGALLTLGTAQAQEHANGAERALAREHFAKGVALAKARAYAEALSEFERAYAAVPHFSVLYNIGQARLALGQSAAAVAALQRYLDEGGASIDVKRRAEVDAILARERDRLPPPQPPSASSEAPVVPADSAPAAPLPAAPAAAEVAPGPAAATAAPVSPARVAVAPLKPPAHLVPDPPAPRTESSARPRHTLAIAVGAVGLVLSGAALSHYLWNRGRYQDWQSKYSTYYRDPTEPNRAAANSLSQSIDAASTVTFMLAVGAGAALGTSGVLWLASAPGPDPRRSGFHPVIGARGTF